MDLHIDEIEFTNEDFRNIYYSIIESFNENKKINIEDFINKLSDQQQHEVTNIIMDNEKHVLHNWEKIIFILKVKSMPSHNLLLKQF